MASKTIMVDLEAYKRLNDARTTNESFSQAIRRIVRAPIDLRDLERCFFKHRFSRKAVSAVERQISRRHRPSKRGR